MDGLRPGYKGYAGDKYPAPTEQNPPFPLMEDFALSKPNLIPGPFTTLNGIAAKGMTQRIHRLINFTVPAIRPPAG